MGRQSRKAWQERLWPRDDRGYACDPTLRGSYAGQAVAAVRSDLFKKVDWAELAWMALIHLPLLAAYFAAMALLPATVYGVDRFYVVLAGMIPLAMVWGRAVSSLPFSRRITEHMNARHWRHVLGSRERKGACLACGYALDGATVADDGCLQCPECGAAWRVERVRKGGSGGGGGGGGA